LAAAERWVCLDVGETLIDETRIWSLWADALGIPRLTFLAAFGAAVAAGGEHHDVFGIVGRPDWRALMPEVLRRYGAFRADDLYSDALPSVHALRDAGHHIAIVANQPVARTAELRALGFPADVIAMSDELGVWKPDPRFFSRALALMGDPEPGNVAYVGDRPDNDVRPAAAAGMRAVWLRRGPWGVIGRDEARRAALVVDSLAELAARIDEVFAAPVAS
jgi:HAD superfamily hydrolase (TIGR01549 family)